MMMGSTVVMTMAGHYSNPRCYFTLRIRLGNAARNEMEGFCLGVSPDIRKGTLTFKPISPNRKVKLKNGR